MKADIFSRACHQGALLRIEEACAERVKRLGDLAEKMPFSLERARAETGADLPAEIQARQRALIERWPEMEAQLKEGPPLEAGAPGRDAFFKAWEPVAAASGHIQAVHALGASGRKAGAVWLQKIVDAASALWTEIRAEKK